MEPVETVENLKTESLKKKAGSTAPTNAPWSQLVHSNRILAENNNEYLHLMLKTLIPMKLGCRPKVAYRESKFIYKIEL